MGRDDAEHRLCPSNFHDCPEPMARNKGDTATLSYGDLRDLKRKPNETTVVSMLIDYQSEQAESTRDVITIMYPKDEDAGPTIVRPCMSVTDLHVKDTVRW
jgi:hypothetical protein